MPPRPVKPVQPVRRSTSVRNVTIDVNKLKLASSKLRTSDQEREKFVKDPIGYLNTFGLKVPADLQVELQAQAFNIREVLTKKHDAVASIAVA